MDFSAESRSTWWADEARQIANGGAQKVAVGRSRMTGRRYGGI